MTTSVTPTPTSLPEYSGSDPCTSAVLSILVLLIIFLCCVLIAGIYNSYTDLHRISTSFYRSIRCFFPSGPRPPNNMHRSPGQLYLYDERDPLCPSTAHTEEDPSVDTGPTYGPTPFYSALAATERQKVQQRLVLHEQKIEALGYALSHLRRDLSQLLARTSAPQAGSIGEEEAEAQAEQERSPPPPPTHPPPATRPDPHALGKEERSSSYPTPPLPPRHPGRASVVTACAHFAGPEHPAFCDPECCSQQARFGGPGGGGDGVGRVPDVRVPWSEELGRRGVPLRPLGPPRWRWWYSQGWVVAQPFERPAGMAGQGRALWWVWRPEGGGGGGGGGAVLSQEEEQAEGECACESETDEEMEMETESESGEDETLWARPAELATGSTTWGEALDGQCGGQDRDAMLREGGIFERAAGRLAGYIPDACGPVMEEGSNQATPPPQQSLRRAPQDMPDIYHPQDAMPTQPAGAPNDGPASWLSKHDIEGFTVAILLSLRNEDYPAAIHRDRRSRQGIMLWDRFISQLSHPHERQWLTRDQVHATIYQLLIECDRADANLSNHAVTMDAPIRVEQAHRITAAIYNKAARGRGGMRTLLEEIMSHDAQHLWLGAGKMASRTRDQLGQARIITYPLGHGIQRLEGNQIVGHDFVRRKSVLDLNASTRDERPAVPHNLFDFANVVLRRAMEREERGRGRRSSARRTCGRENPSAGSAVSEGKEDERNVWRRSGGGSVTDSDMSEP